MIPTPDERYTFMQGDVVEQLRRLPDESVHCVVTSPPYYGLRDYGTATWEGGDAACDHKPIMRPRSERANPGGSRIGEGGRYNEAQDEGTAAYRDLCGKCGARRIDQAIGLERTLPEYIERMVAVFREVRRVLRKDGTAWVNMGDSYAQSGGNSDVTEEWGASQKRARSKGYDVGGWGATTKRGQGAAGRATNTARDGFKPKDLMMVPARLAIALVDDGWYLRSEITWCLSHSTRVYARTQKGEMPMTIGEMARLRPETIKLWSGVEWVQVRGIYPKDTDDGYELTLRSGQCINATAEHLWPTPDGEVRTDALKIGDKLINVGLPEPAQPKTPKGIPEQFGYLMGLYLAEGNPFKQTGIQFTLNASEVILRNRLEEFARFYGSYFTASMRGNTLRVLIQGGAARAVVETYVSGKGSKHKHLSTEAWQRSNEFLDHLLYGYLAGDGHYEENTNRWRLGFTRNDALADDLRTLCARLGYSLRLRRAWHQNAQGKFYGFRGDLRLGLHQRKTADTEIIAIRRTRSRRFYDIEVDEPHLFALASGVLTHNCKRAPMPESCTDRPTSATERIYLLSRESRYYYDADAVRQPHDDKNGLERFKGKWGVSSPDYEPPQKDGIARTGYKVTHREYNPAGRNMWNYWLLGPEAFPEAHFATFPTEIPRRAILAGTSERGVCPRCGAPWRRISERNGVERGAAAEAPTDYKTFTIKTEGVKTGYGNTGMGGGHKRQEWLDAHPKETKGWAATCKCGCADTVPAVVLDPFSGAGTTVMVALRLGRRGVGIELNPKYVEMAERRIQSDPEAMNLRMMLDA